LILFLEIPPTSQGEGRIAVLVTDSTGVKSIPRARVSLGCVEMKAHAGEVIEVQTDLTDDRGIAIFRKLRPGEYMVTALEGDPDRPRFAAMAYTTVVADSSSPVRLYLRASALRRFSTELDYRMKIITPDTTREEKMPIYNPQKIRRTPLSSRDHS
jgi:hypothetical protein